MKQRTCKQCKQKFNQHRMGQKVCSPECALSLASQERVKAADAAHRKRKRALRDNDRSFQTKKAQEAFNKYIRTRDMHLPCVSCGRYHQGQYHAGHYRPAGNNSALRFNEINCWKQCSSCNDHLSGNLIPYRVELVKRIGIDLVEWLEKDHPKVTPWTIEELKAIQTYYKDAVKALLADPVENPVPF